MSDNGEYGVDSQAVQVHLGIIQSVITRMAANSASCKTWCITLVSAILVVVASQKKPQYALIAFIPAVLFCALDTYYLALEKRFRDSYNAFVKKFHKGAIETSDLYAVKPGGTLCKKVFLSLRSFSIYPFYLALFIIIVLVRLFVS